ncbi:MAG: hypothetical protein C0592_05625 [Marinilabiliales bacterium]|nr:MAG: hypothetical protein C0592_05625 [Marinilabiliales bacterium]
MNRKIKLIIQVALAIGAIVFAYFIYESIMGPVRFNQERDKREDAVVQRLKDIRSSEEMYNNIYGRYTASFDTLISFIKEGQIPIIKLTARPGDSTFTNPIIDTIGYALVMDSIFKDRPEFSADNIRYIPYSDHGGEPFEQFVLTCDVIEKGNVPVNVIECSAMNKQFLKGMNLKRYNIDPEDGLRFGSMYDPTTDGNWE